MRKYLGNGTGKPAGIAPATRTRTRGTILPENPRITLGRQNSTLHSPTESGGVHRTPADSILSHLVTTGVHGVRWSLPDSTSLYARNSQILFIKLFITIIKNMIF